MPTSLYSSLALLSLCWATTAGAQQDDDPCAVCDDVHIFLARGNNEPYPGRQGLLVEAICNGLASCGYEDLHYSALYTDLSCQTTYDGSVAGHVQMTAYAEKCPDSKLILAGYSQGAQIAGDILGGGSGLSFNGCEQPETPAMDPNTSPGNKIAAIIAFGDTRHNADQPWNFGSGSGINGLYPRSDTQLEGLKPYGDRMRNWCVETDPICAANQADSKVADHLGYFNVDSHSAASWIKSVASLTNTDDSFTTTVPISISGTAQDYATVPTATPSGSVKLDTTWTDSTSFAACTATSYSHSASSMTSANATVSNSGSSSSSMSATTTSGLLNASSAISSLLTQTSTQVAAVTSSAAASPSDSSSSATVLSTNVGGLLGMVAAGAFFGMVLL